MGEPSEIARKSEPVRLQEDPISDDPPETLAVPREVSADRAIDQQRGCLSTWIATCLIVLVFGSLYMVATGRAGGSTLAEVLDILVPALIGIFGTIVGFYFATERIRPK